MPKFVARGIDSTVDYKEFEEEADNQVVSYPENIVKPMTPVVDKQPRRYVPLVGSFKPKGSRNVLNITTEQMYDPLTGKAINVYFQMNTENKSFLEMHYYLKSRGIKNNKFHLILFDPELATVDPYDPNLTTRMKQKIFVECQRNFFYYIREVVRIQSQGGPYVRYKLDRGNLALNFCFTLNLNVYEEQPRQTGKTVGTETWYSWVYNFGSRNANMIFLNKKHDDAKRNLNDLKNIIQALPSYLRFDQAFGVDGKKLKARNSIGYLQHKINFNRIEALPMARDRTSAISLLRGRTITNCWIDESAFFKFLEESLQNGMPALTRAFANCKMNGAPHGLCLTSTPGFLSTEEGRYMFEQKCNMTPFSELWYDKSLKEIGEILESNEKSVFVYIRTTYQQLGYSEDWLKQRIKEQGQKWTDIRREFLLEWATTAENCPFTQEQLNNVRKFVREPKKQIYIGNFLFNLYEEYNPKIIPIIGVDVAAGYNRDSSAISCIDSTTTKLFADFNCNYISTVELGKLIYLLVTMHMPNALVVIERNGVGTGCIATLMKTKVKNNLYYEVKERTAEEQLGGGRRIGKRKQWRKVYGLDNTKMVRENLMELLQDRVEDHYDKFISPIIYEELKNLEYKNNGKIDHSTNSHDDSIFSYLLSLYPLYYGKNLRENWNIKVPTLTTAGEEAEEIFNDLEATDEVNIGKQLNSDNDLVNDQMKILNNNIILYKQFLDQQQAENDAALAQILSSKVGRRAYSQKYNIPEDTIDDGNQTVDLSGLINSFYREDNTEDTVNKVGLSNVDRNQTFFTDQWSRL